MHGMKRLSVFSTYVEVILDLFDEVGIDLSFLHVCGGDPKVDEPTKEEKEFSPRMWR